MKTFAFVLALLLLSLPAQAAPTDCGPFTMTSLHYSTLDGHQFRKDTNCYDSKSTCTMAKVMFMNDAALALSAVQEGAETSPALEGYPLNTITGSRSWCWRSDGLSEFEPF